MFALSSLKMNNPVKYSSDKNTSFMFHKNFSSGYLFVFINIAKFYSPIKISLF